MRIQGALGQIRAKITARPASRCVTGFLVGAMLATPLVSSAADGMITIKSAHGVATTIDKLQAVVESKGMGVFGRVDHAAGATKAGIELPPTQLLIFGNPKAGTPLMKCSRSIAIDLPQKALAWEDADGVVWLAYNDPEYLKARHATEGCDKVFANVAGALAKFAEVASAAE